MALPSQNSPIYTMVIPSTDQKVKYRSFFVKEQKSLLIAQQSEDLDTMLETLKDVVKSCVIDKVDMNSLATFDLEYMFTQIRAKSVGEVVDLFFFCNTCTDEKAKVKISIDLTKLEVKKQPEHNKKIELFSDVGVIMKYPSVQTVQKLEMSNQNDVEMTFDLVVDSIDCIYDSNELYHAKDQSKEELTDFVNNLTQDQFIKIQKFFDTMPSLKHEVEYKCAVCGKEHKSVLEGLSNFFL